MIDRERFKASTVQLCVLALFLAGNASAQDSPKELSEEQPTPAAETPAVEAPVALDEINVTAGYSINRDEPVATSVLTSEEILELPHFGDDVFRELPLLPGITGNDVSAQFNVRGGLYRENLQRIDGQEIYEPYHLKDFQGVFRFSAWSETTKKKGRARAAVPPTGISSGKWTTSSLLRNT